ncbi:methylglyoxal synthase [Paramaledivibacter caminithermalis]|uniref:Methylglyoxal synthase n=1 Tax=Paramaledivibacter caminithermalis (strain DSM 15212 / CIP 107654 / DViRD3) TaxID=1121301 RepID=A0A1M6R2T7_PARC5|nr:methylglyoxal synthase [Paramaledivibacter caminithermalis]SHK26815.1 methylglyoxal synthase [Paramaledivibacter caminithermalis DSM 15212]
MNIALIAHDKKKPQMINFTKKYKDILKNHKLCATGTTGRLINEETDLEIERFLSGPLGGDQQIGSRIACDKLDLVIFLRDPLTAQPHEPDILALIRLCDVHSVPIATNISTAEILLNALHREEVTNWREIKNNY